MDVVNPGAVVVDRLLDRSLRQRFFKGIRFDEPTGDPGWFGSDSPVWYVHEHVPALILGVGAAALIETLHPDFAWAGFDHSRAVERVDGVPTGQADPEGLLIRAGHSYSFFLAVAHGPAESAERVVRAVRGMHSSVKGTRPDGRAYDTADPVMMRWAYATVVWGIGAAHQRYHPRPLSGDDLDQYFRQFTRVGEALGGIDLPATKAEVDDLLENSLPLMGVTTPTMDLVEYFENNKPGPPLIRPLIPNLLPWAMMDLQPPWAKRLFRVPRYSAAGTRSRRAAVWSALNAAQYGGGPIREVRQARARVAG